MAKRLVGSSVNYFWSGQFRKGKRLSNDGYYTQKQAQREFGDDYKYIKVKKDGVCGVPKDKTTLSQRLYKTAVARAESGHFDHKPAVVMTRKFDGRTYYFLNTHTSKKQAQAERDKENKAGYNARCIKRSTMRGKLGGMYPWWVYSTRKPV